jgi:hypothetical protein
VEVCDPFANAKCNPHTLLPPEHWPHLQARVQRAVQELENQTFLLAIRGGRVEPTDVGMLHTAEQLHLGIELLGLPRTGVCREDFESTGYTSYFCLIHGAACTRPNLMLHTKVSCRRL